MVLRPVDPQNTTLQQRRNSTDLIKYENVRELRTEFHKIGHYRSKVQSRNSGQSLMLGFHDDGDNNSGCIRRRDLSVSNLLSHEAR
jgi:hypothetical protein